MSPKPARKVVQLPRRARHARHPRWQAAVAGLDARVAEIERRFARLDRRYRSLTVTARMRNALVFSVLVHAFVIFGVTFKMPDRAQLDKAGEALEVVLVNAQSQVKPAMADALAQHNLDGGGNTEQKQRAQSPLPVVPDQKQEAEVKLALRRVEQLEREARQLITQRETQHEVEAVPAAPQVPPQPQSEAKPAPNATDILQRSFEMARLEGRISKDWSSYQERPRKTFIGARTHEYRFARYVEDWRLKIQRWGDMNYPQAARDQGIHGRLLVTVAVNTDGSVAAIEINKPSGFRILDDAARRIVQLAAPFEKFPSDIARDTDVLYITRWWTFTPADQFVSE